MIGAISTQEANSIYSELAKESLKKTIKGATNQLEKLKKKDDEFISTCSDGQDDGKLSFKEKASTFGRGVINHYTEGVRTLLKLVVEHPKKALLVAGGCLAGGAMAISILGAPLVLGSFAVCGVIIGGKGIFSCGKEMISAYKTAQNAKTDTEAKQAIYDLGGSSIGFVDNVALTVTSAVGVKEAAKVLRKTNDYARILSQSEDEITKKFNDLIKKMDNGTLTPQEKDILKKFLDKEQNVLEKFIKIGPNDDIRSSIANDFSLVNKLKA